MDLGTARKFRQGQMSATVVGTRLYMASEVMIEPYNMPQADMHSVGITILVIAVGPNSHPPDPNETGHWSENFNVEEAINTYKAKGRNCELVQVASQMIPDGPSERIDSLGALKLINEIRPSSVESRMYLAPHHQDFTECYREIAKCNGLEFISNAIDVASVDKVPTPESDVVQSLRKELDEKDAEML